MTRDQELSVRAWWVVGEPRQLPSLTDWAVKTISEDFAGCPLAQLNWQWASPSELGEAAKLLSEDKL